MPLCAFINPRSRLFKGGYSIKNTNKGRYGLAKCQNYSWRINFCLEFKQNLLVHWKVTSKSLLVKNDVNDYPQENCFLTPGQRQSRH